MFSAARPTPKLPVLLGSTTFQAETFLGGKIMSPSCRPWSLQWKHTEFLQRFIAPWESSCGVNVAFVIHC